MYISPNLPDLLTCSHSTMIHSHHSLSILRKKVFYSFLASITLSLASTTSLAPSSYPLSLHLWRNLPLFSPSIQIYSILHHHPLSSSSTSIINPHFLLYIPPPHILPLPPFPWPLPVCPTQCVSPPSLLTTPFPLMISTTLLLYTSSTSYLSKAFHFICCLLSPSLPPPSTFSSPLSPPSSSACGPKESLPVQF